MIKDILRGEKIEVLVSQSSKNGMVYCGDDYFFFIRKNTLSVYWQMVWEAGKMLTIPPMPSSRKLNVIMSWMSSH